MNKEQEKYLSMFEDALTHQKGDEKTKHAYEWFKRKSYYQIYKERKNEWKHDN